MGPLTDVVEHDEYILLAFDIDLHNGESKFALSDYVWFVFKELDGVLKVWVKYRPPKLLTIQAIPQMASRYF